MYRTNEKAWISLEYKTNLEFRLSAFVMSYARGGCNFTESISAPRCGRSKLDLNTDLISSSKCEIRYAEELPAVYAPEKNIEEKNNGSITSRNHAFDNSNETRIQNRLTVNGKWTRALLRRQ